MIDQAKEKETEREGKEQLLPYHSMLTKEEIPTMHCANLYTRPCLHGAASLIQCKADREWSQRRKIESSRCETLF